MLRKASLYIGLFLVAFGVRYFLIKDTPTMDKWIDLVIYVDGGQLIANGINPYNFLDEMELRDSLRRDTVAYNYYVDEIQERWNFYANSNLPLSLLYYGVIEKITDGDLFSYRIVFAIMDCLLSVMLAVFIFNYWKPSRPLYHYLAILGLGALCPVLLYHGALLAEDKGVQVLLMIGALYFSKRQNLLLGAFFLGWSVAFKGLGVFIAPLCLYYFIAEPDTLKTVFNKDLMLRVTFFVIATAIFAIQPFIPYFPDVLDMMFGRLDQNLNMEAPIHSSVWRFIHVLFPASWQGIKLTTSVCFLAVNIIAFVRKSIGVNILTASLLLWFVDISLLGGSLDRMNIGFLITILLVGITHINAAFVLTAYYTFAGSIVFFSGYLYARKLGTHDAELFDSVFGLGYVLLYLIILAYYALKGRVNTTGLRIENPLHA